MHAKREPPPLPWAAGLHQLRTLVIKARGSGRACLTCEESSGRLLSLTHPPTHATTQLHSPLDDALAGSSSSAWTVLPPLPPQALPRLECLSLDCVGLQALPPSWCR